MTCSGNEHVSDGSTGLGNRMLCPSLSAQAESYTAKHREISLSYKKRSRISAHLTLQYAELSLDSHCGLDVSGCALCGTQRWWNPHQQPGNEGQTFSLHGAPRKGLSLLEVLWVRMRTPCSKWSRAITAAVCVPQLPLQDWDWAFVAKCSQLQHRELVCAWNYCILSIMEEASITTNCLPVAWVVFLLL